MIEVEAQETADKETSLKLTDLKFFSPSSCNSCENLLKKRGAWDEHFWHSWAAIAKHRYYILNNGHDTNYTGWMHRPSSINIQLP